MDAYHQIRRAPRILTQLNSRCRPFHLLAWIGLSWVRIACAQPANDNFTNAQVLVGLAGSVTGTTADASKEAGEPNHAGNVGGRSIWYRWTAPKTEWVFFETVGSSCNTLLAAYQGSSLGTLLPVAANDDFQLFTDIFASQSALTFNAVSGTVYRIAVDGYQPPEGAAAFGSTMLNWCQGQSLPDLIVRSDVANPQIVTTNYARTACEVLEGCGQIGPRRLLRFATETINIGLGDLILGNPVGNPLFRYDPCHNHYHFTGFAEFRLRDSNGVRVAGGRKLGFCVQDTARRDPNANPIRVYSCERQGLQVSWSDTYAADLPCQFIDITDLPDGAYTLELELDPDDLIAELSDVNNLARVPVILGPPPAHDDFAHAQALSGPIGQVVTSTLNATWESGEPAHAATRGGRSIWFRWKASDTTLVIFDTLGSAFDTLLGVYRGDSVDALELVTGNDDAGPNTTDSRVRFETRAGEIYWIAVDGFDGSSGRVVLNWRQGGPALPDLVVTESALLPEITLEMFAPTSCEVLEGCVPAGRRRLLRMNTSIRNIATTDLSFGDPVGHPLFEFASCHDHYHFADFAEYRLRDSNGVIAVTGQKLGFCLQDTAPWEAGAKAAPLYTCANQGIQAGWRSAEDRELPCHYLDITDVPDGTYTLEVEVDPDNRIPELDESNNVARVAVILRAPPHDHFINAQTIRGASGRVMANTLSASKEPGEPNHAGDLGGRSIWYRWTAPAHGPVVMGTTCSDLFFDTVLGVYTGGSVEALTVVAENDDFGPPPSDVPGLLLLPHLQSQVSFNAVAGQTYHVAVDGVGGNGGMAGLNWHLTAQPPQPTFSAVPTNGGTPLTVTFTNQTAGDNAYLWDFGDGQASSGVHPTHTYAHSGVYTVRLTANGPGGSATAVNSELIRVAETPRITRIELIASDVEISFTTIKAATYTLERTADLGGNQWTVCLADIAGTGGIVSLAETNGAGPTNRFYRVQLVQ